MFCYADIFVNEMRNNPCNARGLGEILPAPISGARSQDGGGTGENFLALNHVTQELCDFGVTLRIDDPESLKEPC